MSSGDASNVRDRAMFDNLMWHRSRFTAGMKTIVWCATVHAMKQARVDSKLISVGLYVHQPLGARAAAIGFSALTGSWDQLLDGIIVLRQERPPEYVRSAKPQQATQ